MLARTLKTSPIAIANKIVEEINKNEENKKYFLKTEAVMPGFINFVLTDEFIDENLKIINDNKNFNIKTENPKLYFLDYGGPNIAKPLHVGHLRSPIIGESVKRIINYSGNKTLSDVHFGDFGLQIGEVIYGLKERNIKPNEVTLSLLNEIYPNMSARVKEDENLYNICAEITKNLQDGDKSNEDYYNVIKKISMNDILNDYKYLDINFDFLKGESDSYKYISELTNILNNKNLLKNSEGAKVIDICKEDDKKELPPLIYQKSNGAYLYGTTDMATVLERVKLNKPDHIIYFADIRQQLHYTQFFRAISKADVIDESKLEFYGFGTVNGKDGRPYKTREGKTPHLKDLFKETENLLLKNKEMDLENEEDIHKIVNSVIKFADLQNNFEKDYIFDLEKFSKIEGKTGPYLLYTYARMNKVLNKFKEGKELKLINKNKNNIEKELKLKLLNFNNVFTRAFNERRPSILADFVYDLSTKLNTFYEANRFNDSENEEYISSWLYLINVTLKMIKDILNMLVIETVKKM